MNKIKKLLTSLVASFLVVTMVTSGISAIDVSSTFTQNTKTANTYGFVDQETDKFETYSDVAGSAGNYTSIASKIYKPVSGDTLIVVFHGNGEGGVDGVSNNYSQIAANRLAVTYASDDLQAAFKGAYVLAFQAPDYWYNDYTEQAKDIIDQAIDEFGIKQVFVSGLSAGGLMTQRMLAKYGEIFDGALMSCAAIAKNGQYIEGLGGDYNNTTEFLDQGDPYTNGKTFQAPNDIESYMANYMEWLEKIAMTNVPIFMVHCYYDTTIYYQWTELAYEYIQQYRIANDLDGDIYCGLFEDVSYPDETFGSAHWSWIKMLNGDVYASTNSSLDTISWFKSLSTSTNNYEAKVTANPSAGASGQDDSYMFNLIATVTNSGEKVTAIEIDMNGKKVDAQKLTVDMFKVTGYNEDASGLAVGSVKSSGIFGTEKEPMDIEVAKVSVNDKGNIVIDLATQNGVLNYTSLARNLATNVRYNIAPVALPLVEETTTPPADNTVPSVDDKKTSVKTGDDLNVMAISGLMILSLIAGWTVKKELY